MRTSVADVCVAKIDVYVAKVDLCLFAGGHCPVCSHLYMYVSTDVYTSVVDIYVDYHCMLANLGSLFYVSSPNGELLFDHLKSIFLSHQTCLYYYNIFRWRHHLLKLIIQILSFFSPLLLYSNMPLLHK